MKASAETMIDRPRAAVFEYMDVPENQARISPRLSAVETLGTFDNGGKRAGYTYRLFGLPFEGEVKWTFETVDDGTLVTYTAEYDLGLPPVVRWFVRPLVTRVNRRELDRTLQNLNERMSNDDDFS
ncbi:SRPBCC family protein [Halobacteriales archaeon QS_9_68_42]|nr:MAG: SRPBCC family protein [Halobacteriales archaeon QS_9_68_42]